MGRITVRTTIDAPPEIVFGRLADIERMAEYSTLTRAVSYITPGPVREGTRWAEDNPIGPIRTTGEWVVEEYERPNRLVFTGAATFVTVRVVLEVEGDDGKTRVEQVTDYEFLPPLSPLGRLLDDLVFKRVLANGQRENRLRFKRMNGTDGYHLTLTPDHAASHPRRMERCLLFVGIEPGDSGGSHRVCDCIDQRGRGLPSTVRKPR